MAWWPVVVAAILGGAACREQKSLEDELRGANRTGMLEAGMLNCPSAVPGSTTVVEDRPDGVALTVTAKDEASGREIMRRAHFLTSLEPIVETGEHTGLGTGGGRIGYCPVVRVRTLLSVENIDHGARILVRAQQSQDVPALQRATRERAEGIRVRAGGQGR